MELGLCLLFVLCAFFLKHYVTTYPRVQCITTFHRIMKNTTLLPATPAPPPRRYGSRTRHSRQRQAGSDGGSSYPVTFTEYGVVEDEELFLHNVRPGKTDRFGRKSFVWDTVIIFTVLHCTVTLRHLLKNVVDFEKK